MIFAESEEDRDMSRHIESADLPEDIARLAEAQVAAGRFATVEDVVRAGVEALAQMEQKRAAIRAALEEGERSGIFEGDAFASVRSELGLAPR
jgi:antitoxin ParD1/3/4